MTKTFASLAAVACVSIIATVAAPHASSPDYQYGLTGNAWWAGLRHAAVTPAPARASTFQYGLMGNEWWATQAHRRTARSN